MSSYVQEKKKGQSRALGCNARSDHHSEALALARYLMNRTKLAQQCGGLPDDLTIELISPSAKPTRSIRHPWRILVAIRSVDPPALHQARPSEGLSLAFRPRLFLRRHGNDHIWFFP